MNVSFRFVGAKIGPAMLFTYLWMTPYPTATLFFPNMLFNESGYHNWNSLSSSRNMKLLISMSMEITTGFPKKLVLKRGPYLRNNQTRNIRRNYMFKSLRKLKNCCFSNDFVYCIVLISLCLDGNKKFFIKKSINIVQSWVLNFNIFQPFFAPFYFVHLFSTRRCLAGQQEAPKQLRDLLWNMLRCVVFSYNVVLGSITMNLFTKQSHKIPLFFFACWSHMREHGLQSGDFEPPRILKISRHKKHITALITCDKFLTFSILIYRSQEYPKKGLIWRVRTSHQQQASPWILEGVSRCMQGSSTCAPNETRSQE